jgi:hypothetical protein
MRHFSDLCTVLTTCTQYAHHIHSNTFVWIYKKAADCLEWQYQASEPRRTNETTVRLQQKERIQLWTLTPSPKIYNLPPLWYNLHLRDWALKSHHLVQYVCLNPI